MDELFVSTDTVQQAVNIIQNSQMSYHAAGSICPNGPPTVMISCLHFLPFIPPCHPRSWTKSPKCRRFSEWSGICSLTNCNTLLINWKAIQDRNLLNEPLVCVMSSVFDPLGMIAPVTIRFRIIQQTIWSNGLNWDDQITLTVLPEFFVTNAELPELSSLTIRRQYFRDKLDAISLHEFTDDSYFALAAVADFVYCRHRPIFVPRLVRTEFPSCIPSQNPNCM